MGPLNYKTAFSKSFNSYHPISQVGLVFAPAVFVGLWFLLTLFKDHRWGNNKLFSIPTRPLLKFVKEKAYVEHLNLRILLKVIKKQEVLQSDDLQNKIVWNNNLQHSSLERQFVRKSSEWQFAEMFSRTTFANKLSGISICKKSAWHTNFQNLQQKKWSTKTIFQKVWLRR